ncbi:MAG: hypothetical protein WCG26_00185 [Chloroflexales bacterium]
MNLDFPKAFAALLSEWVEVRCSRQSSAGLVSTSTGRALCAILPGGEVGEVPSGQTRNAGQRMQVTVATTYWPAPDGPAFADTLTHPTYGALTVQEVQPDGADFWNLTCLCNPRNSKR